MGMNCFMDHKIRLHKFLSKAGVASLRKSEQLIDEGRVKVNHTIITTQGVLVDDNDIIMVDDTLVSLEKHEYYVLNKPKNTISSVGDDRNRKDVISLIKSNAKLFPVGRLDKDTTGLLLITNDGDFANTIMHPSFNIKKSYQATIGGSLTQENIESLKTGVVLDDNSRSDPAEIEHVYSKGSQTIVKLTISQGKNRIVRRMFQAIGKKVIELHRYQVGNLTIEDLKVGQYRTLRQDEIKALYRIAKG